MAPVYRRLLNMIAESGSIGIYVVMQRLGISRAQLSNAIHHARSKTPSTRALRCQDDVLWIELTPLHADYGKAPLRQEEDRVEAITYDDVKDWT
jgi:hypothetical protein